MVATEIFKSIQGESTYAGLSCVFVRLTGYNLRCTWCDTAYALYGGTKMKIPLVELTGGEPLLQADVHPLAEKLLAAGYTVLIETSGEHFIGKLPREVVKIVDVKCRHSGEADTFDMANLEVLDHKDEVKFVIASRRDYEFAREFTAQHCLPERIHQVLFSPVMPDPEGAWTGMRPRALAEWILADGLPVRLGLQLRKFIWDPAMCGV